MKYKFKKHLKELKRTRAGAFRDISSGLFLDRNERNMPYGPGTMRLLGKRIAASSFNLYPDVSPFYKKLAGYLGIEEASIYVTEGVSGAIKSLIETIAEPGGNIIFPVPTFALYPVYAGMFDLEHRTAGYTADYKLDVGKMLSLLDRKTAILFLPNPNVPIEGALGLKEISRIASECARKGAFLAVDEVYYGFGGPTAAGLIGRFDNIFVMRSFSKAFGLAGIRIGYILGSPENIDYVSKTRTGYETNTASMEIASFFLDNRKIVEEYIKDVKEGIAYLKREFDRLGLEHNGGRTSNFIFVNLRDRDLVRKISHELAARKIYIRSNWQDPYDGGFSVTAASKEMMKTFMDEFSKCLGRHRRG